MRAKAEKIPYLWGPSSGNLERLPWIFCPIYEVFSQLRCDSAAEELLPFCLLSHKHIPLIWVAFYCSHDNNDQLSRNSYGKLLSGQKVKMRNKELISEQQRCFIFSAFASVCYTTSITQDFLLFGRFFGPLTTDEFVRNNSFVNIKGPSILEIFLQSNWENILIYLKSQANQTIDSSH